MPRTIVFFAILSTALLFTCAGLLHAGEATKETVKCPIGNESVSFVGTLGCTVFGDERYMSFAPVSSCDFIERLPQCPKSKLPLYKEFSKDEVKRLRKFSTTDEYRAAETISRYYLAYVIEKHLDPSSIDAQLNLLVDGLWYDSQRTYANDIYFRAFSDTMNAFTPAADQQAKDILRAIGAYGLIVRGNPTKAKEIISAIKRSPLAQSGPMKNYVGLLEKCIKKPKSEECAPDFVVSLSE